MVEELWWNTIFTGKVTDIAFTLNFCNNYSHPASLYFTSPIPVPHVPVSHSWCPQVPRLASPILKSPHMHPNDPIPLSHLTFIHSPQKRKKMTQEKRKKRGGEKVKRKSPDCCMWYEWYFSPKNYHESLLSAHAQTCIALHWDQKAMKYTRVNSFVVSFSSL